MDAIYSVWTQLWAACPLTLCGYEFMQRALVAAALIGLAAPSIGIFLVQRRLSLMGDGIGHVAFTGVAAGFLLNTSPVLTAVLFASLGAVVIELLREQGRTAGDQALAVIFYGGIAGGVLLLSLSGVSTTRLTGYLFGEILSVDQAELWVISAISVIVVALTVALRKRLFAVCYDEEVARVSGVSVRRLNLLMAVVAAVTIAVSMRVVGILLVSAMLVLPVAAVQQVTISFRSTAYASSVLGLIVCVGGLIAAYYINAAPGGTIVIAAILCFVLASGIARIREIV